MTNPPMKVIRAEGTKPGTPGLYASLAKVPEFLALFAHLILWSFQTSASAEEPASIDDVQARIASTSEQLQALNEEISRTRALKDDLQSALQKAESGLGERDSRVRELHTQIARYDQQLINVSTRIKQVETDVDSTQLALADNLRAAHKSTHHSTLKILLQHENPVIAQRMQIYSSYVFKAQRDQMQTQLTFLQQLKEAQDTLLKDRNWLNHIRKKATRQREGFVQAARQNRSELLEVDRTLAQKEQSIAQLSSDQERLQTLMEDLKESAGAQSGYFESRKGEFELPVAEGSIQARFGELKNVGKLRWNGLFIQSPAGTAVTAMADGEVLYSDWLQGFGMLVILEHGDGYMSLYGGNRPVLVQQGEWVESGSTIATVGDSGGQNTSGLYFEIRQNASALDPESWVRIDQS